MVRWNRAYGVSCSYRAAAAPPVRAVAAGVARSLLTEWFGVLVQHYTVCTSTTVSNLRPERWRTTDGLCDCTRWFCATCTRKEPAAGRSKERKERVRAR